jgi:hypothetical protein
MEIIVDSSMPSTEEIVRSLRNKDVQFTVRVEVSTRTEASIHLGGVQRHDLVHLNLAANIWRKYKKRAAASAVGCNTFPRP